MDTSVRSALLQFKFSSLFASSLQLGYSNIYNHLASTGLGLFNMPVRHEQFRWDCPFNIFGLPESGVLERSMDHGSCQVQEIRSRGTTALSEIKCNLIFNSKDSVTRNVCSDFWFHRPFLDSFSNMNKMMNMWGENFLSRKSRTVHIVAHSVCSCFAEFTVEYTFT